MYEAPVPYPQGAARKPRAMPYRNVLHETFRWICRAYMKLNGWSVRGDWPGIRKAIIIGAPHTSNWDAVWFLCAGAYYRARPIFLGKQSLTEGPFGGIVKWLGCVPVNQSERNDLVKKMLELLAENDEVLLGMAPEGTRGLAEKWRSGFHHIAMGTHLPIIIAAVDYETKSVGIAGVYQPTGDYEEDMANLMVYFSELKPKHPERFSMARYLPGTPQPAEG